MTFCCPSARIELFAGFVAQMRNNGEDLNIEYDFRFDVVHIGVF